MAMKNDNWTGREERRKLAVAHTEEMDKRYADEIRHATETTKVYGPDFIRAKWTPGKMECSIAATDSVSAVLKYGSPINSAKEGRNTAVLNFASYKHPGGMFIDGSKAQEECLCHESFLYNVLREKNEYYNWNNKNLNRALYRDRALYTPDVRFIRADQTVYCNVITCAAPNLNAARSYWELNKSIERENANALYKRLKFVLAAAADNNVKTLILGAFGCGVFGQDPEEVGRVWKSVLCDIPAFDRVIFAVLPGDGNLEGIKKGFLT